MSEFTPPKFLVDRDGKQTGEVKGTRPCRMAGCTGVALVVRWPEGDYTYPCTKGTERTDKPDTWRISR